MVSRNWRRSLSHTLVYSALVAALLLSVGVSAEEKQNEKAVAIGVIIVQTGPLAHVGQGIVNAIVMAAEQRDPQHRVRFIYEDDGMQPAKAVTAAEKLISQDHVSALITFAGGSSAAIAPIAERYHIPLITIAAGDLHTVGRKYVYRLFLSTNAQVDLLRTEMERAHNKRTAIVTTTQESLVRLRDLMKDSAGGNVIADVEVPSSDTDMQSLATRIVTKSPDSVVLYLLPPQIALFTSALHRQGFRGQYYGGIQVLNYPQVVASQGALIGTIFPAPAITDANKAFSAAYEERFKERATSEQEVYGYDSAAALIAAAKDGDIQRYLEKQQEIPGLSGTYVRRENNFFEVPAALKRINSMTSVEAVSVH